MRWCVLALALAACSSVPRLAPDGGGGDMQISGEPLAEAMGRRLPNFSRDRIPTDLYFDSQFNLSWIDLTGFSAAIESYEYSKQPMNAIAFESSAGTSLAFAPLVNPG